MVTQPDRPRGRGQHLVPTADQGAGAGRTACRCCSRTRLHDERFLRAIAALDADLGVVAAYGKILPDALLAMPRLGMINVHASLLPR